MLWLHLNFVFIFLQSNCTQSVCTGDACQCALGYQQCTRVLIKTNDTVSWWNTVTQTNIPTPQLEPMYDWCNGLVSIIKIIQFSYAIRQPSAQETSSQAEISLASERSIAEQPLLRHRPRKLCLVFETFTMNGCWGGRLKSHCVVIGNFLKCE